MTSDGGKSTTAITDSEQSFRILVDAVKDYAIYMLDLNGIITSWNSGAERIKGYTADEIIGKSFSCFYPLHECEAGVPVLALKSAALLGRYETEAWRVRKDGSQFWASVVIDPIQNDKGELIGYAKVTRDITERRNADEHRILLAAVFESNPDAILIVNDEGLIVSTNQQTTEIFGHSRDALFNKPIETLIPQRLRHQHKAHRSAFLQKPRPRSMGNGLQLLALKDDGTEFPVDVMISPMNLGGKNFGIAIVRDVTERKKMEAALQDAQTRAFQLQKMEAVGKLTAGIAHDFNNLLQTIAGSLSIINDLTVGNERVNKLAKLALDSSMRGASLVHQLLSFSRRQILRPALHNVNEIIRSLDLLMRNACGELYSINILLSDDLWLTTIDSAQFQSALINLVVNACDAMPKGGRITIKTENIVMDGARSSTVFDAPLGEYVLVTVSDIGEGMTAEVKDQAFEPFFTTKEVGKGSGLGLSQVYGFAKQSLGYLDIQSEVGVGTSIQMYLPKAVVSADIPA